MELIWEGIIEALDLLMRGDSQVLEITLLSLELSGLATLIALAFGVPFGALLAFKIFPGRGLTVSLINTGMGLPPVVVGLGPQQRFADPVRRRSASMNFDAPCPH